MRLLLLLLLLGSLPATETSTALNLSAGQSGVWLNSGTNATSSSSEANFAVTVTPGRPVVVCLQCTQTTTIGTVSGSLNTTIAAGTSYNILIPVTGLLYFSSASSGTITATPLVVLSTPP
jgi:hypothetical protein